VTFDDRLTYVARKEGFVLIDATAVCARDDRRAPQYTTLNCTPRLRHWI